MIKLLLGIIIVFVVLYNRLLRIRLPRELFTEITVIQFILFSSILIGFIITLSLIIYKAYIKYYNIKPKEPPLYISYILKHPWNPITIFVDSMKSLDVFIKNSTPSYNHISLYSDIIIMRITRWLITYPTISEFLLIALRILPQLIVCLAFCYDVVIANYFYYFYKLAWILILPMFISYIVYSVNEHTTGNLRELNAFLNVRIIKESDIPAEGISIHDCPLVSLETWAEIRTGNQHVNLHYRWFYTLAKDKVTGNKEHDAFIFNQCMDYVDLFMNSYVYFKIHDIYKEVIITPFNVVRCILYIFAWSYLILYGIGIL